MRLLSSLTLYMALLLGANAALAADTAALKEMRTGDMKRLIVHSEPKPLAETPFTLADGAGTATLAEYRGKYVLLNFWATWCAPCRKEMPMLSDLQTEFGGEEFEVLTLATGRNSPARIKAFFDEIGVTNLPRHQDPRQAVAREVGVLALPITVLIDPEGREIARLLGDAEWNSDDAKAIIRALIAEAG